MTPGSSSPSKPRIVVDWDGTCVEDVWPEHGAWLPGAATALQLLDEFAEVVIFTCRVAGFEFPSRASSSDDVQRSLYDVGVELTGIKSRLAEAGLEHLEVWQRPYKPPAIAYVDDKAIPFSGDWRSILVDLLPGSGPSSSPPIRHPNSARYHELLAEAGELHDKKQSDYGRDDDPFANVRASEEWDVPGWVGAMVRLNDKVRRLQSLAKKGSLANEAALDSFMDIAVYALIAHVLYEQENTTSA